MNEGIKINSIFTGDVNAEEVARKVAEALAKASGKAIPFVDKIARGFFDGLAKQIHPTNRKNGFWDEPVMMDKYVAKLALIHSEVTEVLEALRKSQGPDKVTEEFADIIIRLLDLYHVLVEAGEASPELFGVVSDKMQANANRPPKHGNRWG